MRRRIIVPILERKIKPMRINGKSRRISGRREGLSATALSVLSAIRVTFAKLHSRPTPSACAISRRFHGVFRCTACVFFFLFLRAISFAPQREEERVE